MAKNEDEQSAMMGLMAQMATAIELLSKSGNTDMQEKLAAALERVADAQRDGSALIASETRRAHRPSNEVVPQVSVFNRRGTLLPDYQKPLLKCIMFIPWVVEWESITREEVELLNLLEPGEYVVKRVDGTKIKETVRVEYGMDEMTPSKLLINHETAFNNDNFKLSVAMTERLRQMLKQHSPEIRAKAAAILSDEEEEAMIEAGELSVSR